MLQSVDRVENKRKTEAFSQHIYCLQLMKATVLTDSSCFYLILKPIDAPSLSQVDTAHFSPISMLFEVILPFFFH